MKVRKPIDEMTYEELEQELKLLNYVRQRTKDFARELDSQIRLVKSRMKELE